MERKDKRKDEGCSSPDFAVPIEASINSDGTMDLSYLMHAHSEEGFQQMESALENVHQTKAQRGDPKKTFGFSESNWNATWNPEGPAKNWRTPPANPSLN